jgi:hypothetical protein
MCVVMEISIGDHGRCVDRSVVRDSVVRNTVVRPSVLRLGVPDFGQRSYAALNSPSLAHTLVYACALLSSNHCKNTGLRYIRWCMILS